MWEGKRMICGSLRMCEIGCLWWTCLFSHGGPMTTACASDAPG